MAAWEAFLSWAYASRNEPKPIPDPTPVPEYRVETIVTLQDHGGYLVKAVVSGWNEQYSVYVNLTVFQRECIQQMLERDIAKVNELADDYISKAKAVPENSVRYVW